MDLAIDEVLVGRTLGRITPLKEKKSKPVMTSQKVSGIDIHLVSKDHYHLLAPEGTEITGVFINTAHRAVPISYVTFATADEPMFWSLKFGAPSWVMVDILFLPGNPLRPLDSWTMKRVGK